MVRGAVAQDTAPLAVGDTAAPPSVAPRVTQSEEPASGRAVMELFSEELSDALFPYVCDESNTYLTRHAAPPTSLFQRAAGPPYAPLPRDVVLRLSPEEALQATKFAVPDQPLGGETWVGVPVDDPFGLVILSEREGAWEGSVSSQGRRWRISGDDAGVSIERLLAETVREPSCGTGSVPLFTSPADSLVPTAGGTSESSSLLSRPPGEICGTPADGTTIDVVVVLTTGTMMAWGLSEVDEAAVRLTLWFAWANAALHLSGVDATFRWVGVEHINLGDWDDCGADQIASNDMLACLHQSPVPAHCAPVLSERAEILALRDAYGADLVHVVTDGWSEVCGPGPHEDVTGNTEPTGEATGFNPFASGPGGCVTGSNLETPWSISLESGGVNTFTHELAHQLGAGHHESQQSPLNWAGDNLAYVDPDCGYSTIMAAVGWCDIYTDPAGCAAHPCPCFAPGCAQSYPDISDIHLFSNPCIESGAPRRHVDDSRPGSDWR